jgi:hypothetical protein
MSIRSTHCPQLLFEGMLARSPYRFLFGRRQSQTRTSIGDGSIVDVLDLCAPSEQVLVRGMVLLQVMDIT